MDLDSTENVATGGAAWPARTAPAPRTPIVGQLRVAAARFHEAPPGVSAPGAVDSRLRVEQRRVFAEFGRYLNDVATDPQAGSDAPFGRIIQPPRTGKTVVAAHIIARTGLPSVVVVPTRTLVMQTIREMAAHAPSVPVGTFYSERKDLVAAGLNVTTYSMLVAAWESGRPNRATSRASPPQACRMRAHTPELGRVPAQTDG